MHESEEKCIQGFFLVEKPEGNQPLQKPRRCGRIRLKWIFEK
jgi:hypothetical protein